MIFKGLEIRSSAQAGKTALVFPACGRGPEVTLFPLGKITRGRPHPGMLLWGAGLPVSPAVEVLT